MTYTYRPAEGRDGAACAQIVQDWCIETPWLDPLENFEGVIEWWSGCLYHVETSWVAEKDGAVLGFCVRQEDNITGLYIGGRARSKGIGKHLLDLAKQDRDWITVWAYEKNTEALRFYKREGLIEVSRDIEEGTNLVDIEHQWHKAT